MFTGIVQGLCPVVGIDDRVNLRCIAVRLGEFATGVENGASVAINGTCLTVTGQETPGVIRFDVIRETLKLTNLGTLREGDLVNVERSFRVGDEVGGHILSGHVADTARVVSIDQSDNLREIRFQVAPDWMKYLPHKGFVALDGASLTLARVDPQHNEIVVSLIPETIQRTTLGRVTEGSLVNLEIDAQTQAVVDTVERMLSAPEALARFANQQRD